MACRAAEERYKAHLSRAHSLPSAVILRLRCTAVCSHGCELAADQAGLPRRVLCGAAIWQCCKTLAGSCITSELLDYTLSVSVHLSPWQYIEALLTLHTCVLTSTCDGSTVICGWLWYQPTTLVGTPVLLLMYSARALQAAICSGLVSTRSCADRVEQHMLHRCIQRVWDAVCRGMPVACPPHWLWARVLAVCCQLLNATCYTGMHDSSTPCVYLFVSVALLAAHELQESLLVPAQQQRQGHTRAVWSRLGLCTSLSAPKVMTAIEMSPGELSS